ncbi:hypothetical protein PQR08_11505 [Caballeronia jiangsuensis]|uniref:Uncharacterized protein n=1 Tax=Caballeronia jiangsuensis TaxID=1458357 RepID=A0ABW9CKF0_9BURK
MYSPHKRGSLDDINYRAAIDSIGSAKPPRYRGIGGGSASGSVALLVGMLTTVYVGLMYSIPGGLACGLLAGLAAWGMFSFVGRFPRFCGLLVVAVIGYFVLRR